MTFRDDFYIVDCAAETFRTEYIVKLGWMIAGVVSNKMRVSLLEPGVANMEIIGCGEFQNSLTFSITFTKVVPTKGITLHTSGSTAMTIPVINCDEYLSGWDFSNSMLQLVIAMFLDGIG